MTLTPLDPDPLPLDHLTLRGDPAADALLTREGLLDYAGLEEAVSLLLFGHTRGLPTETRDQRGA